jgi:lia operon protein LiaG
MNNDFKKVLIVIWGIIAIGLIAILVYGISNRNNTEEEFSFYNNAVSSELTVQKDENIDLNNINKINVEFSSSNIIVQTTDEPSIRIVQQSSRTLTENEKFTVKKQDNEVTIKRGDSKKFFSIFSFTNMQDKIEVYIPENYIADIDIETSSGNIEFNSDIKLSNVNCKASSGCIVSKDNINATDVNLEASSGDISLGTLITNNYNVEASSGNIKINSLAGSGKLDTSSGNIKVQYKDIAEYSEVNASSGNIDLVIPEGLSFDFSGQCSSGRINSKYDLNYKNKKQNEATVKIGSGPYKKVSASTNSGNININD